MDITQDPDSVPTLPSQIKARLQADQVRALLTKPGQLQLKDGTSAWGQLCVTCGQAFWGAKGPRKHCFTCLPPHSRLPGSRSVLTKRLAMRGQVSVDARRVMADRVRDCQRCGYRLFVDICHVRPVRSFASTALLQEINAPDNLIFLCPNCHREFDAGLWDMAGTDRGGITPARYIQGPAPSTQDWRSSRYRGVRWDKMRQRWRASLTSNGKTHNLGRFATEREAALAYNAAALRLHGEHAIVNDLD